MVAGAMATSPSATSCSYRRLPDALNYTVDLIQSCKNSLERLYTCRENLDFALTQNPPRQDETPSWQRPWGWEGIQQRPWMTT